MKHIVKLMAIATMVCSLPANAGEPARAATQPGTSVETSDLGTWNLLSDPNMAINVGVWDSNFFVRDRQGNLIQRFRARKNMQVYNNVYYQINEYWYEDGSYKKVRFIGVPRKDGGVETDFLRIAPISSAFSAFIPPWARPSRSGPCGIGAPDRILVQNL